jgi:hypothetical protein
MSKVSISATESAIVPVTDSAIVSVFDRIISEPFAGDEMFRDTLTGYECVFPTVLDDIRASGKSGCFEPVGRPGNGDPNEFIIIDYREVRLTLSENYINHLFYEIFFLPIKGSLRRLALDNGVEEELGSASHRVLSVLIPAERNGKSADISKKGQSKTGELFSKCLHSASKNNSALWGKLSPEEKKAIPDANEWIQRQGGSSIFKRVVETCFIKEKAVVDGKEVVYFSMKFTSRSVNPDNLLEQSAVLFAEYIREDAKKGNFRCVTNRFLIQESYVSALRLSGFGGTDTSQIEGEIVDETKLLTPAF